MIYDRPYMIEILTPKMNPRKPHGEAFERFSLRYLSILESVCAVSIPDNPLGTLRFSAVDTLTLLKLPVESEKVLINVNTFHSKDSLDSILRDAHALGIRYLLVVRGDGGPLMQVLKPADIGVHAKLVTSEGLLSYINREFKDTFITGAAFNQYKPISVELRKLKKKIEAGARFVITQPAIGKDHSVDRVKDTGIPLIVEAWMSQNIDLFLRSVKGRNAIDLSGYDPAQNLETLHEAYPDCCLYLSLLRLEGDWKRGLPRLR